MLTFSPTVGFCTLLLLPAAISTQGGTPIPVPNFSFESPATDFAYPQVNSWQRSPKPDWFVEDAQQQWAFLTGVFKNTPEGSGDHINNLNGQQALFLFAYPQVALFQDDNTIGGTNTAPTHEFEAKYEPGQAYQLTAALIGGGGNMKEGVTLRLSLYYRDALSNMVTVAATTITNSPETFRSTYPSLTNLVDFHVITPATTPQDAWAGKNIGLLLESTVGFDLVGGYWNIDNLRLAALSSPWPHLSIAPAGAHFEATWPSVYGKVYQAQVSNNLKDWANLGEPQRGTSGDLFQNVNHEGVTAKFIRVQEFNAP